MFVAVIILSLLLGVFGFFAAIFSGILWLIATHWVVAFCIGIALWLSAAFAIRVLLETM